MPDNIAAAKTFLKKHFKETLPLKVSIRTIMPDAPITGMIQPPSKNSLIIILKSM
jgi:hypothetical protein